MVTLRARDKSEQLGRFTALQSIYKLTKGYKATKADLFSKYGVSLPVNHREYIKHKCPYSTASLGACSPATRMRMLRPYMNDDSLFSASSHNVHDNYQVGCIRYLARLRDGCTYMFSGDLLAMWVDISPTYINVLRHDTSVPIIECTLFDIKTDLLVMGTPKKPTAFRKACLKSEAFRMMNEQQTVFSVARLNRKSRKNKDSLT